MEFHLRARRAIVALSAGLVLLLAAAASAAQPPGKPASFCGNGTIEKNEQCDQSNVNGKTCEALGFETGTLSCGANCQLDTTQCSTACGNGVVGPTEQCEVGSPPVACADLGEGFGSAQCGPGCTFDTSTCSADRFVDNDDGTVSDFQEGLMWEMKVAGSSFANDSQGVGSCLHCVDDEYDWTTAMSEWVSSVSGRTNSSSSQPGLANHTDWRLPTIGELVTIQDCTLPTCIDPIFGSTASSGYWSASTVASDPSDAFVANFGSGCEGGNDKGNSCSVRAVRTGP